VYSFHSFPVVVAVEDAAFDCVVVAAAAAVPVDVVLLAAAFVPAADASPPRSAGFS